MSRKLYACGVSLALLAAGCATPWEKSALLKDNFPEIDRIKGPTLNSLINRKKKQDEESGVAGNSLKPIKGTDEYLAAVDQFKDKKYEDARKSFKKVAKTFKKSEIREDALFMEAEAAWQQEYYAQAHDAYAVLLKEYPSTRHMNVVSERMFKLGRLWLEFPEVAKLGEIQQVNFEEPTKALPSEETPKVPKKRAIFIPNFRDKKEPLFDTAGNGVAALSSVWMNDPTGPLADDAMMLVASYHARRGNYVEADRYFQMLRETFPNSPHVQNAFVLGSHVKLMSYQGPTYESRTLQEAQLLKESTLRLYPNLPESDRIREELARIEDSKALIIWSQAEFYLRKKNKRAASINCHQVIKQYPKSPYAKMARAKLVELGPEYESGAVFLTSVDPPKTGLLERILETPPNFRLKKYPLIGAPRETSTSDANAAAKSKGKSTSKSDPDARGDDQKKRVTDDPLNAIDPDPEAEPEKPVPAPKKRRRSTTVDPIFQSQPDDGDSEANSNNSGKVGRASL